MKFIIIAELSGVRYPKALPFEGENSIDVARKFYREHTATNSYILKILNEGEEIHNFYIIAFEIKEKDFEDFSEEDFFDVAESEAEIWKKFKDYLDKHYTRREQRTIRNKELEVIKVTLE